MSGASRIISLKHIKEPDVICVGERKPRVAWPGGRLVSNKDDAVVAFLRRKQANGEALTAEQLVVLQTHYSPAIVAMAQSGDIPALELEPEAEVHIGKKRKARRSTSMVPPTSGKKPRHEAAQRSAESEITTHAKIGMSLDDLIAKKKPMKSHT
jgi:hypothetical protein